MTKESNSKEITKILF